MEDFIYNDFSLIEKYLGDTEDKIIWIEGMQKGNVFRVRLCLLWVVKQENDSFKSKTAKYPVGYKAEIHISLALLHLLH